MLFKLLLSLYVFKSSLRKFAVTPFFLRIPRTDATAQAQLEYLDRITDETKPTSEDWTKIKSETLSIWGPLNDKTVDSAFLKRMIFCKKYDAALSFAEHLKKDTSPPGNLNIGSINGILQLYAKLGPENITEKHKAFILELYTFLYEKYKVLDSDTCARLLRALCAIKEWKKAVKVFEDIPYSGTPRQSTYSDLIAMFFTLNNKNDAMKYIERSMNDNRPPMFIAYKEWIDYILRNYSAKETILKYLEEMCVFISRNCLVVNEKTAKKIKDTYASLGWNAQVTTILKNKGQCTCCKKSLDCLKLTDEEFQMLQQNVKEKIIVGSDLLTNTSQNELYRFNFMLDNAPFDIVLDGLNIALSTNDTHKNDRVNVLKYVVNYFLQRRKKVLFVGRKHMMEWPNLNAILSSVDHFFIENISEDDPYFITAAILSGPHTDIMSADLLRSHKLNLQDEKLRFIFQKWQWQHQWKVILLHNGLPCVLPPLPITPIAQNKNSSWHLPFEKEVPLNSTFKLERHGTPDWNSWLCLRPSKTSVQ